MFDLEKFIDRYVTHRNGSMFAKDIEEHKKELQAAISGKSVLVIGGAGSIGILIHFACCSQLHLCESVRI